jgi:hypothetical protein
MRLASILAIAACGQSAPPPLAGRATSAAPATPEPTVRWGPRAITAEGLPAIASDGSTIAIAHRDSDGGRGNPNLTLIEKDRNDRELGRFVVLTATEADDLAPAQIEDRFQKAAVWLHERHTTKHLVPLTALVPGQPTEGPPASVTGNGVTLRWTPNQLTIERGPSTLLRRPTPLSWLAPEYPMCRGCSEVCRNDAFLGGGYLDIARRVAIVVVTYRGTDLCWEPSAQEHVVTWESPTPDARSG